MTGTLNLDRLRQITDHHGAALRLLGDHYQFSAVESGGALRLLASETPTVVLEEVHRFQDPAEATASLQLREGDNTAVEFYAAAGRLHAGASEDLRERAYQAWLSDTRRGKTSLMIAGTNSEVTALSARARADLLAAGKVAVDGVTLHDRNEAGTGGLIVTPHAATSHVKAGSSSRTATPGLSKRGTATTLWPFCTPSTADASSSLPSTSPNRSNCLRRHRAPVPRPHRRHHLLIDRTGTGRTRSTYGPATPGKEANHLYFTVDVPNDQPLTPEQEESEAQAAFVRVLNRNDAECSATETLRNHLARAGTIPDFAEKLAYSEELRASRASHSDPRDESVLNVAPWITVAPVGEEPRPDSLAGRSSPPEPSGCSRGTVR